jgi:hypothetical protein
MVGREHHAATGVPVRVENSRPAHTVEDREQGLGVRSHQLLGLPLRQQKSPLRRREPSVGTAFRSSPCYPRRLKSQSAKERKTPGVAYSDPDDSTGGFSCGGRDGPHVSSETSSPEEGSGKGNFSLSPLRGTQTV